MQDKCPAIVRLLWFQEILFQTGNYSVGLPSISQVTMLAFCELLAILVQIRPRERSLVYRFLPL